MDGWNEETNKRKFLKRFRRRYLRKGPIPTVENWIYSNYGFSITKEQSRVAFGRWWIKFRRYRDSRNKKKGAH